MTATEPTPQDLAWMAVALNWSRCCPPVTDRFNVGAVIAISDRMLAYGYSRETDAHVHAEESALLKAPGIDLTTATMYTTLEPCSIRHSRPRTCTQLIIDAGIRRVVYAVLEPPLIVDCEGVEQLQAAGIDVIHAAQLTTDVLAVNRHLVWPVESM